MPDGAPAAARCGPGSGGSVCPARPRMLAGLGADRVVLHVDDGAPPGGEECDRRAADRLYDRAGPTGVDRPRSFTRRP